MTHCRWNRDTADYLLPDGEPCRTDHCRVCGHTHVAGIDTCPECLAVIRANITEIRRMCDSLPDEVEHRGINGEAMMLLGPAADPEGIGHMEASIAAGRIPPDYLEKADHENHPLFVLGTWDMVVRDALEHDEPSDRITVDSASSYISLQLTYLARFPFVPIEDLARDMSTCRAHLESVLRDGDQVERGAPCITCSRRMTKTTGDKGEVTYECHTCHRRVPEAQYRYAVGVAYIQHADRLTLGDMSIRVDVPTSTLRRWASGDKPALLSCGRDSSGRKVYRVETVEALMEDLGRQTA